MLEMHLTCPHCKKTFVVYPLVAAVELDGFVDCCPAVIHPLAITGLKKSNRPFCSWQILTSA